MSILLHEWFEKFLTAYGLEFDETHSKNEGLHMLHWQIMDTKDNFAYKDRYNNVKCMTLIEFKKYWDADEDNITDLTYDKKTGYVILNFRYNSNLYHELFAGAMLNAIENTDLDSDRAAELYLDRYGFFKSSASSGYGKWTRAIIGNNLKLTADEKIAFKSWEFIREKFG